jgi:hypothetical protein
MLKANASRVSTARHLGRAVLLGAALFAALLATVAAQDAAPITPAQLGLIEDMVNGTIGHNQEFLAQPVQLLGLHGNVARQMDAQDDKTSLDYHFFNLFSSDPGAIVLIYQTEKNGPVRAYRLDERLRFARGYMTNKTNVFVAMSAPDGVAGVQAELKWWSGAASGVVQDAQKALASGQSADDVAKSYGVSTQTLNKWLAAAQQP